MNRVRISAAVLVLAGLVAVPGTASAATTCTATLLPAPPGTSAYEVAGTDGAGTFVGSMVDGSGRRQGVVWRDGGVSVLDQTFVPNDINESGLMGGYVTSESTGRAVAALRPLDGPVRRLDASYSTFVNGVNDGGDAVGGVFLDHPVIHIPAGWYAPDYEMNGFFGGYREPLDIDDTGLAIGVDPLYGEGVVWAADPERPEELRKYTAETMLYDIDEGVIVAVRYFRILTIDGRTGTETVVPDGARGVPFEINNGVIVGSHRDHAAMWRAGETVVLPAVPGTTTREARAVNETGTQVAGVSVREDGAAVPTLWECSAG
jgi:uncharacterized membrane protein